MEVKKLSDKQIKVSLNREEIEEKNIDVKGILKGSSQAKESITELIYEVIEQVGVKVDGDSFVSLDIPHASEDNVELVLTILDIGGKSEMDALRTISNLFKSLGYGNELEDELNEFEEKMSGWGTPDDIYGERTNTMKKMPKKTSSPTSKTIKTKPIIYSFENIEYLAKVASILLSNKITFIDSKVYQKDARYFLVLTKKSTTKIEKAEAILSEYGVKVNQHEYVLKEHGKLLIKNDAINVLNTYF